MQDFWIGIILGLVAAEFAFFAPFIFGARLLRSGQFQKALFWCQLGFRLSRLIPNWRGIGACYLGACYACLGDYATALPYLEEAEAETRKRKYRKHLASSLTYLGVSLLGLGDYARAEEVLTDALSLPKLDKRLRRNAESYLANACIHLGKFDKAEPLLRRILEQKGLDSDTRGVAECNLSSCFYYRGEYATALELARKALQPSIHTAWVQAHILVMQTVSLLRLGGVEEAQQLEPKLIALLPQLPNISKSGLFRAVADLALHKGDYARARSYAEEACAIDITPNSQAGALLIQAEVFAAQKNTHRALTLCEDILRLDPLDYHQQRARALRDRLQAPVYSATALSPEPIIQQNSG